MPFYKKARAAKKRGESIPETDLPVREMKVYSTELLDISYDKESRKIIIKAKFSVGSGTYIRSLAEELGRRLGYPATLQSLRRTQIGQFRIEDAETL